MRPETFQSQITYFFFQKELQISWRLIHKQAYLPASKVTENNVHLSSFYQATSSTCNKCKLNHANGIKSNASKLVN